MKSLLRSAAETILHAVAPTPDHAIAISLAWDDLVARVLVWLRRLSSGGGALGDSTSP